MDEELPDAIAGRKERVLREHADACAERVGVRGGVTEDLNLATRRREVTGEHGERGGLAGAVGADEPVDLAGGDSQAQLVHGERRAERLRDAEQAHRGLGASGAVAGALVALLALTRCLVRIAREQALRGVRCRGLLGVGAHTSLRAKSAAPAATYRAAEPRQMASPSSRRSGCGWRSQLS